MNFKSEFILIFNSTGHWNPTKLVGAGGGMNDRALGLPFVFSLLAV